MSNNQNPEANQSICPTGWTLPYISNDGSTSDFATLWTEYGWDSTNYSFSDITNLTGAPLYFTPAGYFYGNLGNVGGDGFFWSSVAYNDSNARYAFFYVDGSANPASDFVRFYSASVRCLLR